MRSAAGGSLVARFPDAPNPSYRISPQPILEGNQGDRGQQENAYLVSPTSRKIKLLH
jgi:hypothetical protein